MSEKVRAALAIVLLASGALACERAAEPGAEDWRCLAVEPPEARPRGGGDFAFTRWRRPEHAELRLAERSGEIAGDAAPAAGVLARSPETGVLARLEGEALAAFAPEPLGDEPGARLRGPTFAPPLANAARLSIRLHPGGATRVRVIPFGTGMRDERMKRSHQTLEVALERDAAPDEPVELVVDVSEVLRGNWTGAATPSELERLELELPGATPDRVRLERIVIEDERALFAGARAGLREVERDGIVRPAWYVNGGARVRLRLRVPEGAPELRWHDAAAGAALRTLGVLAGRDAVVLSRAQGTGGWSARRAALAAWAGREVVLELASEGPGTALFGDPRIVLPAPAPETQDVLAGETPDVVLYLIDTLRADAIGAFGSPRRGVTPVLDRLAREGVVFARAISTSSWTKPAIPTLMTGLHPAAHGVGATSYTDRLPVGVPLLQAGFRAAGWRAGSFAANPLGSTLSGLERGFGAAYTPRHWHGSLGDLEHPPAALLHASLLAWIDEEPDLPFFAYVHTLEPHEWERPRYAADLPRGWDAYDAAVHDADTRLGELLEALEARGRRPLVVVASDHGESLGEHGVLRHGTTLHQTELHVPLVFWAPGRLPSMTVTEPVSLEDIAPTLLELMGLPALPAATGVSLARWPRDGSPPAARAGVSSELGRYVWTPSAPRGHSLVAPDGRKRIEIEGAAAQGYDLAADPCEVRPLPEIAERLAAEQAAERARESAARAGFVERHGEGVRGAFDAGEAERLRALGYVE
jgi:arylsulfatase A-like enzyme